MSDAREQVLDAFLRLLAERGYDEVSLGDVGAASSLGRTELYRLPRRRQAHDQRKRSSRCPPARCVGHTVGSLYALDWGDNEQSFAVTPCAQLFFPPCLARGRRPCGTHELCVDVTLHCYPECMSAFGSAPEGADHQWRRKPPGELSINPVAEERLGRVTGRAGAS